MLNEPFVVGRIKPYLNSHNELSWEEFSELFSGLTKQEQYEVINITIKYEIEIVDEKEEETAVLDKVAVLRPTVSDDHDFRKLMKLKNEQLCLLYQKGDNAALAALIENNKRMIYQVALKVEKQFRKTGMTVDDMFQEGTIGLAKAAERFRVDYDSLFVTYAWSYVHQAITRAILDTGFIVRLPVHVFEKVSKIQRIRKLYPNADEMQLVDLYNDKYPDDEPIMSIMRLRYYIRIEENYLNMTSLNKLIGEDEEMELMAMIPDPETLDEKIEMIDMQDRVADALDSLTEKQEDVLRRRFGIDDGRIQTLEEIGQEFGVTRERIRQIEKKAIIKLSSISSKKKLEGLI